MSLKIVPGEILELFNSGQGRDYMAFGRLRSILRYNRQMVVVFSGTEGKVLKQAQRAS
jgi:hypothetical protein